MRELDKVLSRGERVLWEGRPVFWPFLSLGVITLPLGGVLIGALVLLAGAPGLVVFAIPYTWILLFFAVIVPLYKMLVHKNMWYAVTDRRVIFQHGLVGRDFSFADFDQISNLEVNVGVFDKLWGRGTGSIRIFTPGTFASGRRGSMAQRPYVMSNVPEPYRVMQGLKKLSLDVRADIQYPNQYRPPANPGYTTRRPGGV
ncbi:MAG: PH domain-containing protein [Candidatus Aenigmarchaeota archaeon]|nr:PH domain-containing protein [Candidatus Aenigmarchaeota archaeon]